MNLFILYFFPSFLPSRCKTMTFWSDSVSKIDPESVSMQTHTPRAPLSPSCFARSARSFANPFFFLFFKTSFALFSFFVYQLPSHSHYPSRPNTAHSDPLPLLQLRSSLEALEGLCRAAPPFPAKQHINNTNTDNNKPIILTKKTNGCALPQSHKEVPKELFVQ
jgi:hypothetical protein